MTVVFVAPDDSDEEDLANCEGDEHLKYQFITEETEHRPTRPQATNSSSSDRETIHRLKDLNVSNGAERRAMTTTNDQTDTASIDSNHRSSDGPSVIDRYLKHQRQYLPLKRSDSKE